MQTNVIDDLNKNLGNPPQTHQSSPIQKPSQSPLNLCLKNKSKLVCPICGQVVPADYVVDHIRYNHKAREATCLLCTRQVKTKDYRVHVALCRSKNKILKQQLDTHRIRNCFVRIDNIDYKLYSSARVILHRLPLSLHK